MTKEFETKDSGERLEFETGSRRDTQNGKPRYDLVGVEGLTRLAGLMARGAEKYGENNWRLGQKASRYYSSMFRHMMQWAAGDDSEDHLAAVCFNAFGIMHLEEKMPEHLDHERYPAPEQPPDPVQQAQDKLIAANKAFENGPYYYDQYDEPNYGVHCGLRSQVLDAVDELQQAIYVREHPED